MIRGNCATVLSGERTGMQVGRGFLYSQASLDLWSTWNCVSSPNYEKRKKERKEGKIRAKGIRSGWFRASNLIKDTL